VNYFILAVANNFIAECSLTFVPILKQYACFYLFQESLVFKNCHFVLVHLSQVQKT